MKQGPLETPYDPGFDVPSTGESTVVSGTGYAIEGGPDASPNLSELPNCPSIFVKDIADAPAKDAHVDVDDKVTSPGIPFTQFGSQ